MSKIMFVCFCLFSLFTAAQDKKALDSVDRVVIAEIITPAEKSGEEPAWADLKKQVTDKYSATEADRAITKAQIYYYYFKDWPKFCAAIVHYTEKYEDKDDLKLMNTNAQFILQHSAEQSEFKTALQWIKHAVDKEPANSTYQETFKALSAKIQ